MADDRRCETCEHWCPPVRGSRGMCRVYFVSTRSVYACYACEHYEPAVVGCAGTRPG